MTTAPNSEALGPAERILQTLLSYQDHLVHNRPGVVVPDATIPYGVRWEAATHKVEGPAKNAYLVKKVGKKTQREFVGAILPDGRITRVGHAVLGEFRNPGLFPEAIAWVYRQCAEVWRLDNEFAAKWASKAFSEEHKDLKVVLCALMLAQSRKGDHVGELTDVDYRDIGEAMVLLRRKDGRDISPKLLLRVGDVLMLPGVAQANRDLGFARSLKNPHMGRYNKVVQKYLRHREDNPLLLAQAVKAGWSDALKALARRVGYKPTTEGFFKLLRWKQTQAKDGRRALFPTLDVVSVGWAGKTEKEVCEAITRDRPNWKTLTGMLPPEVGVTRAVMAAAIEAGALSDKDLVILTPTLEELGMLGDDKKTQKFKARWVKATQNAEDLRAANIAKNVRSAAVKETLKASEDAALAKAAEVATRDLEVYILVDISGSMQGAIEEAKFIVAKVAAGIPIARLHVAVFTTVGRAVFIPDPPTQAAVALAFAGFHAGGGTSHASGVFALQTSPPAEDKDSVMIIIGDGGETAHFAESVRRSGLRPQAFGFVKVPGQNLGCVERTAAQLGIPCFEIDRRTFEGTYEVPRVLKNLITSTPVRQDAPVRAHARRPLVDAILATPLLQKPAWA